FTVGALSLDGVNDLKLFTRKELAEKFEFPDDEYILLILHPETVNPSENEQHVQELSKALIELAKNINIVISMPNADTNASIIRENWLKLKLELQNRIFLVEHFGKLNFFS